MAEKQLKPFEGINDLYSQYGDKITNAVIFLIQGFLFVIIIAITFVILLATGIFVF